MSYGNNLNQQGAAVPPGPEDSTQIAGHPSEFQYQIHEQRHGIPTFYSTGQPHLPHSTPSVHTPTPSGHHSGGHPHEYNIFTGFPPAPHPSYFTDFPQHASGAGHLGSLGSHMMGGGSHHTVGGMMPQPPPSYLNPDTQQLHPTFPPPPTTHVDSSIDFKPPHFSHQYMSSMQLPAGMKSLDSNGQIDDMLPRSFPYPPPGSMSFHSFPPSLQTQYPFHDGRLGHSPATSIATGSNNNSGSGSIRRKNASRETTAALKAWLYEHRKNPYPTKGEKIMLAIITKMTLTQISTWFANARRRLKKENKMTWTPKNKTSTTSGSNSSKPNSAAGSANSANKTSSDKTDMNDESYLCEKDDELCGIDLDDIPVDSLE